MMPLVQMFQDSSGPFSEGEKGGGWEGGGGGGGVCPRLSWSRFLYLPNEHKRLAREMS